MKKRTILSLILCIAVMVTYMVPALAVDSDNERVTLGANLDGEQITGIYADFGIERGSVKELFVTNAEEREYLDGLVPEEALGKNALSSIYIKTLEKGEGIDVTTKNINWCTEEMYKNALETAGIEDAKIIVSAPFSVSGTAALMGIYKAYADITGKDLDEINKIAAAKELVVTGNLSDDIGSEDATKLVGELKKILDQTREMNDEELRYEIEYIADMQNLQLTEDHIRQIMSLTRTLEKVDLDNWLQRFFAFGKTMDNASQAQENVNNFFTQIGEFFTSLFS